MSSKEQGNEEEADTRRHETVKITKKFFNVKELTTEVMFIIYSNKRKKRFHFFVVLDWKHSVCSPSSWVSTSDIHDLYLSTSHSWSGDEPDCCWNYRMWSVACKEECLEGQTTKKAISCQGLRDEGKWRSEEDSLINHKMEEKTHVNHNHTLNQGRWQSCSWSQTLEHD